jgi:protein-S-isoprenylcysteine O-methyltransferase Ste14
MGKDLPLFILTLTVGSYWGTVALLALAKRLRHRQRAGILPRQAFERRLWLVLVPVVVAWVLLPVLAVRGRPAWLGLPAWAGQVPLVLGLRWAAAALAVGCYLLSLGCWWRLGRNWSLAVVPKQTAHLVTEGVYRWVRHPIYSLSILLMLATALTLPTGPMLLLACVHLLGMNLKARHEERHLERRFGTPYVVYCRRVGRFWPRRGSAGRFVERRCEPAPGEGLSPHAGPPRGPIHSGHPFSES